MTEHGVLQPSDQPAEFGIGPGRPPRGRVLLVTRGYYPCAAVGSHRAGKFAKYLRRFGWEPTVLTIKEEFYPDLSLFVDRALCAEIPVGMEVIRGGYLEPRRLRRWLDAWRRTRATGTAQGRTLQSGPRRAQLTDWIEVPESASWLPTGILQGLRPARRSDVIWATSPPTVGLCVGAVLSRLTGRPLVVDLRDPWRLGDVKLWPTRCHHWLDRRWERFVLETASRIVVVTPLMADTLRREHPEYTDKLSVIYNGYDPTDFAGETVSSDPSRGKALRVGYFGAVYQGREEYMLELLRGAKAISDEFCERPLHVVMRGPSHQAIAALAARADAVDILDNGGPVPYRQALALMLEMDVLLLVGSQEHGYALPGKLFEYVGAGRPILALTPPGALTDFIRHHQVGVAVDPSSGERVIAGLRELLANYAMYRDKLAQAAGQFTREACTRQLAEILDETAVCR